MIETLLAVDFATLVLIWMVQLLIYPSFLYFPREKLISWHRVYTRNMSLIVGPLMLAQLLLHLIAVVKNPSVLLFVSLVIIVIIWLHTFFFFVPIHTRIDKDKFDRELLIKLVRSNWWRTYLWTLIFILSLFQY